MLSRRRVLLAVVALAAPLNVEAQGARVFRIGLLGAETASDAGLRLSNLRADLRQLGYVEGKNIVFDARWAGGKYERLPALASELVAQKVDVLVVFGTKATLGAKRATSDTPIVMASAGDVVAFGLVSNLARPGGNITGSINIGRELGAKRLSLLKETVPDTKSVAYLVNPANPAFGPNLQAVWDAARSLNLNVQPFEVREPKDIEQAFSAMSKSGISALLLQDETMFSAHARAIAQQAASRRIVSVGNRNFADAGGLIGYGPDNRDFDRRTAHFVDRILKGAKPGELPIEQPTKFDLMLNLKTAKAIGISIPQSIKTSAARVIE